MLNLSVKLGKKIDIMNNLAMVCLVGLSWTKGM